MRFVILACCFGLTLGGSLGAQETISLGKTKKTTSKKGDLSSYAASIKLKKSGDASSGTITITGGGSGSKKEPTPANKELEPETDDATLKLQKAAADLKSAWSRYQSFKMQVDARCRDYRHASVGGQRYVIPAIETAECKDAITQLRNALPPLRSDYAAMTKQARKDSVEPGTLREILMSQDLLNFPATLSQEDLFLESLLK